MTPTRATKTQSPPPDMYGCPISLFNLRQGALINAVAWNLVFGASDKIPPPDEERMRAEKILRERGLVE